MSPTRRLVVKRSGHPFRQASPRPVAALGRPGAGHPIRRKFPRALAAPMPRDEDGDLKLFVLSFTAFFICIYSFIS